MTKFRDYQLIDGVLYKFALDEHRHLLHSHGSVPAIDAKLWDEEKRNIRSIYFRTNRNRTFQVDKETFNENKVEIDLGYGRQYYIPKELWTIREPK